jgi:hypothetical protein
MEHVRTGLDTKGEKALVLAVQPQSAASIFVAKPVKYALL